MATVPSAPTNLVVTYVGSGTVSISFTPGSNGGSAITNYQYSVDGGESFNAFNPVDTTSPVALSGLEDGVVYTFGLKAVNSVGESEASSFVDHLVYGPADAPTGLISLNRLNGIISLSFVEASNGGSTITNYEYSLDGGSTFAAFNPPQTTSPLSISGLTNNTQYSIVLRAVTEAPDNASSDTLNIFYSGPGSFNNSGTFSNDGTINTTGIVYNTLSIYNSVTITNDVGGILYNVGPSGEIINSTLINNYGNINNAGTFSNLVGSTTNNTNTFSNTLSLCNSGTFANDVGGIIYNTGPSAEIINSLLFDNSGTIDSYQGTFSNEAGATMNNTGIFCNVVGTINNAGIVYNTLSLCNSGTFANDVGGTLYNVGPSGEIINSLIIDNSGTIDNSGGIIDNTGTFSNEVGATINNNDGSFLYTYDGGLLTNDGDINNAGIISTSSGGTCGAGTLTDNGTITDIGSGTQNTDCPP
jgi:hypothetical protein